MTDAELESTFGAVTGVRAPTLEEEAIMLATYLDDCGHDAVRTGDVRVRAGALVLAARCLRSLASLSREGV
ncbi:MAG TPA: hypothetical protein VGD56_19165 [Gemmatirosa sp.]